MFLPEHLRAIKAELKSQLLENADLGVAAKISDDTFCSEVRFGGLFLLRYLRADALADEERVLIVDSIVADIRQQMRSQVSWMAQAKS